MLEEKILIIQESLEDYVENWASPSEKIKINEKWEEIKKALKSNKKVAGTIVIFTALSSYVEDSISSEQNRIDMIDEAWNFIKNKIS